VKNDVFEKELGRVPGRVKHLFQFCRMSYSEEGWSQKIDLKELDQSSKKKCFAAQLESGVYMDFVDANSLDREQEVAMALIPPRWITLEPKLCFKYYKEVTDCIKMLMSESDIEKVLAVQVTETA